MRLFIHLGFGHPVPVDWAKRALRVSHGARHVIPTGSNSSEISRLVGNVQENGFREGVFSLAPWESMTPDRKVGSYRESKWRPSPEATAQEARQLEFEIRSRGFDETKFFVEVMPEIDIDPVYKKNLGLVLETVTAVREATRLSVVSPAVATLASRGRKYLEKLVPKLPPGVLVNFHPYRTGGEPNEFEGFDSLEKVAEYILDLVGGRGFGMTEVGWHNAEQIKKSGCFGLKKTRFSFSEAEVADFYRRDVKLFRALGARFYNWFQIRDGLPDDPFHEAHYGAYLANGEEKAVARAMKEAL